MKGKLHLHKKNKHIRDKRVRFIGQGHQYFIDGDCSEIISSTSLIYHYFGSFDADKVAQNIVKSVKWKTDKSYKYYKKSADEIKQMWKDSGKEASSLGTIMHEKIEYFYNDNEVDLLENEKEFEHFLSFYEDHEELQIYRTEWVVFIEELRLCGSIDATFQNEDGTLSLIDWKRSKEIKFDSFGSKTAKAPLHHLPECNYSQYSLQLNLYRRILEDYYEKTVKDMNIVVCHPDNENYIKIPVRNMDKEIDIIFQDRREYLKNKQNQK